MVAAPKVELFPLFSVPFAEALHPEAERLNPRLRTELLRIEREESFANPHPVQHLGPHLFESEFALFARPHAAIQELKTWCWSALSRALLQASTYTEADLNRIQIFSHTWFHITRKGGRFGLHNHAMASWSGVYCVDPGERVPDYPNSGVLRFRNPNSMSSMYLDPGNTRLQGGLGFGDFDFHLKPGQLVMFPSWMMHEVLPYEGRGERITVAFNCWFQMQPGP